MVLLFLLVNDYVDFCYVLVCLCLIFELILHFPTVGAMIIIYRFLMFDHEIALI